MTLAWQLRLAINLLATIVPPACLGLSGQPPLSLMAYAFAVGTALMLAEQPSFARLLLVRVDVLCYLQVRVALVLLGGAAPYLVGTTIGRPW